MHRYEPSARPQRRVDALGRVSRAVAVPRAVARAHVPVVRREPSDVAPQHSPAVEFRPDPYVDYGRFLTAEGGIRIVYKDLDVRLRHTLWRIFAWTAATGLEGWFLYEHSPVHTTWINVTCFLAIAVINWLIVAKPVEVYRNIEIRPDCMIIEGAELF
jgi:hypothetical protein